MITFDESVTGALAPNHYIEIAKDPGGADGKPFSQPQRILVCLKAGKPPYFGTNPEKDVAAVTKTIRGINKNSSLYFLTYEEGKLADALAILPEEQFTQIVIDNPTQANITVLTTELDSRWKSDSQTDGHLFIATESPKGLKATSKHVTIVHREGSEQTDLMWSAALAALNALYATTPSRPYSTLKVPGLSSSLVSSLEKRNKQLKAKTSTYKTNIAKEVFIDRLITMSEDPEFRSLEVKQTLSAVRYDLRKYFETRFKRYMLTKNGHPYPGTVLSPKSIKALLVARYRLYQSQNLLQDDGEVAKKIRVEISKKDSSKVDIYFPIITMGQLLITQTQIAFRT